jgi:hypothetical protein
VASTPIQGFRRPDRRQGPLNPLTSPHLHLYDYDLALGV